MRESPPTPFDPVTAFTFLADGGAATTFPLSDAFWRELGRGAYTRPETRLVGEGDGWLISTYALDGDPDHAEMHPGGDEILLLLSGALDVTLELPGGERVVALAAGQACRVPRGVWHRQHVRAPGRLLALTYGKGTRHRAL